MTAIFTWLLLLLAPAQAYNFIATCSGQPAHWASGNPNSEWVFSNGYPSGDLATATVAPELRLAFDEWARPGCSEFNAVRGSNTNSDPMGSSSQNIVGFYESNFPPSLGSDTTLAVTLPVYFTSNCELTGADMVFNGFHHQWVVGSPPTWSYADVRSVATHEAGHWQGMDHTNYSGASLYASYSGGLGERTLTCDDTEGVCVSHPTGSNSCSADIYCPCGVGCNGGFCGGTPTDPDPDDDPVGGQCSGSTITQSEQEPNDWQGENDINWIQPSGGGDLKITGSLTCGNNGSNYTGDYDWFVVDFPCTDDARFHLDWDGSADMDFMVWDTSSNDAFASGLESGPGPEYDDAEAGGRLYIWTVCWDGPTSDYTFTVDWAPFSTGPGGDSDTDVDSDADADADADADSDVDQPDTGFGDPARPPPGVYEGCGCANTGGTGGAALLVMLGLLLGRRRMRV